MSDLHATAGHLMGVVRECFYAPDGKAPEVGGEPYDDARDMGIIRQWLKRGGDPERIEAAIRGTALLRDRGDTYFTAGEKLTLRCLNPKTAKYGRHLFQSGADAWEQHCREQARRKGKPLGMDAPADVMRKLGTALLQAAESEAT